MSAALHQKTQAGALRPGVFFGTPDFASHVLQALLNADLAPALVVTQPDRPAGRKRTLTPSAVKRLALQTGLALEQPERLSQLSPQARDLLGASDCAVVVAYGNILPTWLLEAPRFGCLNVHASILPRWRGAAPVQRAIAAGDVETGVSIMQMDAGLDTGPVLASKTCAIGLHTAGSLMQQLADMGAEQLCAVLRRYPNLQTQPQDPKLATYAAKLSKEEARIDWNKSAAVLEREVRAFNPVPVSWCTLGTGSDALRIRVWQAQCINDNDGDATPGTIVKLADDAIWVKSGYGKLILRQIQVPGAQILPVNAILRSRLELFQRERFFG